MYFVILGVILALILLFGKKASGDLIQKKENPLEILQKRYARGEITREQFLEMKQDLE